MTKLSRSQIRRRLAERRPTPLQRRLRRCDSAARSSLCFPLPPHWRQHGSIVACGISSSCLFRREQPHVSSVRKLRESAASRRLMYAATEPSTMRICRRSGELGCTAGVETIAVVAVPVFAVRRGYPVRRTRNSCASGCHPQTLRRKYSPSGAVGFLPSTSIPMMLTPLFAAAELPQSTRGNGVSRAVNQATPGLPGNAKSTFIFAHMREMNACFFTARLTA